MFTIYVQKVCLGAELVGSCGAAWSFERVMDGGLREDASAEAVRKRGVVASRRECMAQCLREEEFSCR